MTQFVEKNTRDTMRKEQDAIYRLRLPIDEEISADVLGECLWVNIGDKFKGGMLAAQTAAINLADMHGCRHWLVNRRVNRGSDPLAKKRVWSQDFPESWVARENGASFLLKRDEGVASGVFTDQSLTRGRIGDLSNCARTLNLFSYTCSFSVASALGGATEVTSVDVSKKYLDWGRQNFKINGLKPDDHHFWGGDARTFLRIAKKQGRQFDLVILDPPSFSRSKGNVFRLSREYASLVRDCLEIAAPRGRVLLIVNLSSWSVNTLKMIVQSEAREIGLTYKLEFISDPDPSTTAKSIMVRKEDV